MISLVRKTEIDVLKSLAALLIVCIHAPFQGKIGDYFVSICRIGVPIFFMITGYFYDTVVERGKEFIQIKKIFRLFLCVNVLYLCWKVLLSIASGKGLLKYFEEILTVDLIIEGLVFNESPFNGHLWYLGALLYSLIIIFMFNRLKAIKILFFITPFLLMTDLIFGKYSCVLLGVEFPVFYVRNFLFVGIPYIIIGMLIRNLEKKKIYIYKWIPIFGILVFTLTTILEKYMLEINALDTTRDHYISTTLLATSVFIYFSQFYTIRTGISNILVKIGRDYSLGIYVLHPIIMTLMSKLFKAINLYQMYKYVRPILIYIVTAIITAYLLETMKLIKKKMNNA